MADSYPVARPIGGASKVDDYCLILDFIQAKSDSSTPLLVLMRRDGSMFAGEIDKWVIVPSCSKTWRFIDGGFHLGWINPDGSFRKESYSKVLDKEAGRGPSNIYKRIELQNKRREELGL